jgi:hypothetical protein
VPKEPETSRRGRALDPTIVPNWTLYVPPPAPSETIRTTVHGDTTENQDALDDSSTDSDDSSTDDSSTEDCHPMIDLNSEVIKNALELRDADSEENRGDSDDLDADHSENEKMDGASLSASSDFTDDDDDDDYCSVCERTTLDGKGEPLKNVLLCDGCNAEVHLRCSSLKTMPADDEPYHCESCA